MRDIIAFLLMTLFLGAVSYESIHEVIILAQTLNGRLIIFPIIMSAILIICTLLCLWAIIMFIKEKLDNKR